MQSRNDSGIKVISNLALFFLLFGVFIAFGVLTALFFRQILLIFLVPLLFHRFAERYRFVFVRLAKIYKKIKMAHCIYIAFINRSAANFYIPHLGCFRSNTHKYFQRRCCQSYSRGSI